MLFCANIMLSFLFKQLTLSPSVFASLRRLAHLTELKLVNVKLNLAVLELAHPAPLPGIRSLMIDGFTLEGEEDDERTNQDTFCRIIPVLFPNMEKLSLRCDEVSTILPIANQY